jgi:hypothetical protein
MKLREAQEISKDERDAPGRWTFEMRSRTSDGASGPWQQSTQTADNPIAAAEMAAEWMGVCAASGLIVEVRLKRLDESA